MTGQYPPAIPPPPTDPGWLRLLEEAGKGDPLNIELGAAEAIDPNVRGWFVHLTPSKIVRTGILYKSPDAMLCTLAVHEGDRLSAGNWLRRNGVPVLRISTRMSEPVRRVYPNAKNEG